MQFLQHDEFDAGRRSLAQADFDGVEVGLRAAAIGFLEQGDFKGFAAHSV